MAGGKKKGKRSKARAGKNPKAETTARAPATKAMRDEDNVEDDAGGDEEERPRKFVKAVLVKNVDKKAKPINNVVTAELVTNADGEMQDNDTGSDDDEGQDSDDPGCVPDLTEDINADDVIDADKSIITCADVIDKISQFNKTTYGLYAVKVSVKAAIDFTAKNAKSNPKYPIVFTSAVLEGPNLHFNTVFFGYGANGSKRAIAMKNGKIAEKIIRFSYKEHLDVYPHQLYTFFIGRGIYVEHVTTVKLPNYQGKDYTEESDKETKYNENDSWDIKSIRNMVFHDPPQTGKNPNPPCVMLLIDWEMKNNKGLWFEKPTKKSCLTWEPFYSLKDYYVFTQYLHYRAKGIEGAVKDISGFHASKMEPDMVSYLRRHGKLRNT